MRISRSPWLLAPALAVALTASATAHAATPLQVSSASALNARTIELRFNQTLSRDLVNMVTANNSNTSYVHQFVRLAGGVEGAPDAALTGAAPLSVQVSGTRNYAVETAADDRLRIVLPATVTLAAGREYSLRLDTGDGTPLADHLFTGTEDGSGMVGSSTPAVTFTGSGDALGTLAQPTAQVRDSRVVRLSFTQPVISGMPAGAYTNTTNFQLSTGGSPALAPVYVEPVPDSDRREYDLYFPADLDPAASYTLAIAARTLNLQTYGGAALPTGQTWSLAGLSGAAPAYAAPEIAGVTVNPARNELRVRFNHRVKWVKAPTAAPFNGTGAPPSPAGTIFVRETTNLQTAGGHSELHAEDVRGLFDLKGIVADDTADADTWNLISGDRTDAANRLRDDAAYWVDRTTLAVRFQSGVRLAPGTAGTIALKPDVVTDVAGKTNATAGAPMSFNAPSAAVTPTAPGYDPAAADYLSVDEKAETTFRHFDYTPDSTGMFVPSANVKDRIVDQKIPAVVVENKYVKVLFTPSYGGRMQSIVYKPTGHDLLYTNPVGTPYGNGTAPGSSPFYNGWLMVYGGVFPTFTEAEHGKYWFVPWDYTVKQTGDAVELSMSKVDDFNLPGHPSKFPYGITGLKITVTYTITKTSPVPRMRVLIENKTSSAKQYEYWTCTTLAPGGSADPWGTKLTAASPETDIVSPNPVIQQYSGYTWMLQQEDRATAAETAGLPTLPNGESYLRVNQLKRMINWSNNGIAYGQGLAANPQGDWWGVVNRESAEGVLRVGENDATPGMKYWEWGFNGSFNTNPYSKGNSGRPYVELWAGASKQFFVPDTLAAGASKEHVEAFLPTMDMKDTTNADVDGAALLEFAGRKVTARVFSTHIGQAQTARIVDAVTGRVIASRSFVADPLKSVQLRGDAPAGTKARLILSDASGAELLTAERADGLGTTDPAVPAGAPTITGKASRGEVLTGHDTTWSGSNATFTYAWLRDGTPIEGATGTTYMVTNDDVGRSLTFRVTATNDAGPVSAVSAAVVPNAETSVGGSVGGSVAPTLSLTLGAPASFGAFTPGAARDYDASTTATVVSTAGDAALSVADPSANATGRLVNGAFSLAQPLQVKATGPFSPLRTDGGPLAVASYDAPVSNGTMTLGFRQTIGANEPLRTGAYAKSLTFTLSTTTP
jgi:hypothetical protein